MAKQIAENGWDYFQALRKGVFCELGKGEIDFPSLMKELEKLGVTDDELKAIDKEIKDIVVTAAKFAEDTPEPGPAELYTDVLVGSY